MAETMRSASDVNGLPYLLVMAFVFGIIHAFMPGHGKSVLVSYHLGVAAGWSKVSRQVSSWLPPTSA
jgi:ABC-type nickel/cobalt efflux system permease component RcnA